MFSRVGSVQFMLPPNFFLIKPAILKFVKCQLNLSLWAQLKQTNSLGVQGCAIAKWSKVLQLSEKINENLKIPGSPTGLGNLSKTYNFRICMGYSSFGRT